MNQRIRELATEAGFSFKYKTAPDGLNPGHKLQDLEKFAELIVRECVVDFYRNYLDTTSDEDITEQVDRYIKEHFGVEE